MTKFYIKELETFSGIKAHTIRIWEQRFNLFSPQRTPGNIRYYTLKDVELLLTFSLLNKTGINISRLIDMSKSDLTHRTEHISEAYCNDKVVNKLIILMYSGDIEAFEYHLDSAVLACGIDVTIQKVIIPFLEKVQITSYKNNNTEAHLVVCAVRKKLIMGIENSHPSLSFNKTAVLFLPKGEHYDLMLLYMSYMLKRLGMKVIYLGTNITTDNLAFGFNSKPPDVFYTYVHSNKHLAIKEYSDMILEHFPGKSLCVAHTSDIETSIRYDNITFFEYKNIINTLAFAQDQTLQE